MERETLFADILLPLPLNNTFTYRVPYALNQFVERGKRVVVQFGEKKLYSGIILKIHSTAPQASSIKYLLSLLDEQPIVTENQLKLWQWISQYYMSHLGEVMNAAIPTSLKLASESKLVLHPEFDGNYELLSDKEFLLVQAIELNTVVSLSEVEKIVDFKRIMPLVKTLIEKKCLLPEEDLKERFTVKKESFVKLASGVTTSLEQQMQELERKAPKQLEVLLHFFKMCGNSAGEEPEVSKQRLLYHIKNSGASALTALEKKGILEVFQKNQSRLLDSDATKNILELNLNQEQQNAFESIQNQFLEKDICLLHGVTGSGKTEIYIKLIESYLQQGKQVLYLLPEIALTAQIINRLRAYFGKKVGYYHSKYGNHERAEVWNRQLGTEAYEIIIGARSSIYLPFNNLGLIIVDEEHDSSYKQLDPAPRYHARDTSMILARLHNAKCLLGSATPSIESYYNAQNQKFGFVELKHRFGNVSMPKVEVVDMAKATKEKKIKSHFSEVLLKSIEETLENQEQIILFQNRRGFSLRLFCPQCQWTPQCKNCDVSLTYHKNQNRLKCHYCGSSKDVPSQCPQCGSNKIVFQGFGTEKIEDELTIFFKEAQIKRMDWDTTQSKNSYLQLISDFEDRNIDILVGTQMVTKGLDFDNVGLVGVLNADQMFHFPDFRAFERSFQQLTQVSGRAGRKNKQGKVLIQTYEPNHPIIRNVVENDFSQMYKTQMEERSNFKYPPFYKIIRITVKFKEFHLLNDAAAQLAKELKIKLGLRVLGPEYPPVSRIRNLYIKNILIKFELLASHLAVKELITQSIQELHNIKTFKNIIVSIDVDPV